MNQTNKCRNTRSAARESRNVARTRVRTVQIGCHLFFKRSGKQHINNESRYQVSLNSQSKKLFPQKQLRILEHRRFPNSFQSVGKSENNGTVEADQASARIARRATRNCNCTSANSRAAKKTVNPRNLNQKEGLDSKQPQNQRLLVKAQPRQGGFKSKVLVRNDHLRRR